MDVPAIVRAALQQAPAYIVVLDRELNHVWVNSLGYGLDEGRVIGGNALDLCHEDDREAVRAALHRCLHGREPVSYTVRCLVPEPPGLVQFRCRAAPVVVESRVVGVTVAASDVPPCATREAPALPPAPPVSVPPGALWLCEMSEQAVAAVARSGKHWTRGEDIAHAVGCAYGYKLKALLASLVSRRILESSVARGYRVRAGVESG
jgi:PAS domain S-box-containing protein